MGYNSRIIIACDFASKQELYDFLAKFKTKKLFIKLGMEFIYGNGFEIISELKNLGHNIFLDLKLHDIPTTVQKALESLKKYEVDFITIHTLGGSKMLEFAEKLQFHTHTKLLGVSILTSLEDKDLQELGFKYSVYEMVDRLSYLAKKAGIFGIISSPLDSPIVKKHGLISVTPGICENEMSKFDQKRVATVSEAIKLGSDFLVIGRMITKDKDSISVYENIEKEIS